jgi:ParB family transcriptional regulator, chromosome partitioning protein
MEEMNVQRIPISEIHDDESFNCRGKITPIDVVDLAKDIREHGLLQPIVVALYDAESQEKTGKKYKLIAGFRRLTAHKVISEDFINAVIREPMSEVEALRFNLSENIQRENLNILQEALAIKRMRDLGLSEVDTGTLLGMSRGWVQVRFMLLGLPEDVQKEAAAGLMSQQAIRDLYTLYSRTGDINMVYEAVKKMKEAKVKGQVVKVSQTKEQMLMQKKHRKRPEIFAMMEHIQEFIGNGLHTRCMAWCSGQITDEELFMTLEIYSRENGKQYIRPY